MDKLLYCLHYYIKLQIHNSDQINSFSFGPFHTDSRFRGLYTGQATTTNQAYPDIYSSTYSLYGEHLWQSKY